MNFVSKNNMRYLLLSLKSYIDESVYDKSDIHHDHDGIYANYYHTHDQYLTNHQSLDGYVNILSGTKGSNDCVTDISKNGKTLTVTYGKYPSYNTATELANGLMSADDKKKLNELSNYNIADAENDGLLSATLYQKLNSINFDDSDFNFLNEHTTTKASSDNYGHVKSNQNTGISIDNGIVSINIQQNTSGNYIQIGSSTYYVLSQEDRDKFIELLVKTGIGS